MFALHDRSLEISKSCLADANTCDVITDCQMQDVLFSQIYMHLRYAVKKTHVRTGSGFRDLQL